MHPTTSGMEEQNSTSTTWQPDGLVSFPESGTEPGPCRAQPLCPDVIHHHRKMILYLKRWGKRLASPHKVSSNRPFCAWEPHPLLTRMRTSLCSNYGKVCTFTKKFCKRKMGQSGSSSAAVSEVPTPRKDSLASSHGEGSNSFACRHMCQGNDKPTIPYTLTKVGGWNSNTTLPLWKFSFNCRYHHIAGNFFRNPSKGSRVWTVLHFCRHVNKRNDKPSPILWL